VAGFDQWADAVVAFIRSKGKVEPGKWRAYGFQCPGHLWKDAKLLWRDVRMRLGVPPAGSSPAEQQKLGLNDDTGLQAPKSEGKKLRQ
jgi:hypothetical protein